jgi:acid stress chaperone HdeB
MRPHAASEALMQAYVTRTIGALFIAAGLLTAPPAQAQTVDMSTITCDAFVKGGKDFIGQVLMWLAGYYADEDAAPVIDFTKMAADGEQLGKYCAENPTVGLITAAEKIFDK